MKIVDTFTIIEDSLLSVRYDGEKTNEFRRLFNLWNNPEYLFNFFSDNILDLNSGFWENITIEQAIDKTRCEAKEMEKKILELAVSGYDSNNNLSDILNHFKSRKPVKNLSVTKVKGL